jgi:4-amino-4-deoxy-L-arabinose transferase-like glycosyltransferase
LCAHDTETPASPKTEPIDRIVTVLGYALAAAAVFHVALCLFVVLTRLAYPFELEWMEGAMVDQVQRILDGKPIYCAPTLEFTPFIYPPLYYYVSALAAASIGVGFAPLRLTALFCSVGCGVVIFLIVRRETRSPYLALLSAGLFAATFRIGGAWFDIPRCDTMFLLFLLLALMVVRPNPTNRSCAIAGLLFAVAFFAKQPALLIAVPVAVYCFLCSRRGGIYFAAAAIGVSVIGTVVLDLIHGGWYRYYMFYLPRHHALTTSMFIDFWTKDLLLSLPIACLLSVVYVVHTLRRKAGIDSLFYLFAAAGMIGGAWFSRLHSGGYSNVLLPAYAMLCLLFGLGLRNLGDLSTPASPPRRTLVQILAYALGIGQFAMLVYNPWKQIPTEEDRKAGERLIRAMSAVEGEVWLPWHGYLPTLAGKKACAHSMAVIDVVRGDKGETGVGLENEMKQAIRAKRFAAVILDVAWNDDEFQAAYRLDRHIFTDPTVLWPVTGLGVRPQFFYVPKQNAP